MTLMINEAPVHAFKYNQNSNHDFKFAPTLDGRRPLCTPFMCKDYLQDIFWTEATGKGGAIHGMKWQPGWMPDAPTYMLMVSNGKGQIDGALLQSCLQRFAEEAKLPPPAVAQLNQSEVVVTFAREWAAHGALISTLTTLIRLHPHYKGEDMKAFLDGLKAIETDYRVEPAYSRVELARLKRTRPRLKAMIMGFLPTPNWAQESVGYAHEWGIFSYPGLAEVEPENLY